MKYNSILDTIGNTPHIRLWGMFPVNEVWIKDERRNPGGSLKDRVALSMIEDAEKCNKLQHGGVIIEPTSGNTGIGLALAGRLKGYKVVIVMPESMSLERRQLLKVYGAELVLTPASEGMAGAIKRAEDIAASTPNSWIPSQFSNPANSAIHKTVTAKEIIDDFPGGINYLVCGVGSAGHISGLGAALKREWNGLEVIAVEPADSPILRGGRPSAHALQGIGANFIPDNYDPSVIDRIIDITNEEAYIATRQLAATDGMVVGISTGANLSAISKIISEIDTNSTILTIAYDSGERYLSCEGLFL